MRTTLYSPRFRITKYILSPAQLANSIAPLVLPLDLWVCELSLTTRIQQKSILAIAMTAIMRSVFFASDDLLCHTFALHISGNVPSIYFYAGTDLTVMIIADYERYGIPLKW